MMIMGKPMLPRSDLLALWMISVGVPYGLHDMTPEVMLLRSQYGRLCSYQTEVFR